MKLRIEFAKSNSKAFSRVLSICRQIATFQERESDGLTLYSVEFGEDDFDSSHAVMEMVSKWAGTVFYEDGKLISKSKAYNLIYLLGMRKENRDLESACRENARLRKELYELDGNVRSSQIHINHMLDVSIEKLNHRLLNHIRDAKTPDDIVRKPKEPGA